MNNGFGAVAPMTLPVDELVDVPSIRMPPRPLLILEMPDLLRPMKLP